MICLNVYVPRKFPSPFDKQAEWKREKNMKHTISCLICLDKILAWTFLLHFPAELRQLFWSSRGGLGFPTYGVSGIIEVLCLWEEYYRLDGEFPTLFSHLDDQSPLSFEHCVYVCVHLYPNYIRACYILLKLSRWEPCMHGRLNHRQKQVPL